MIKKTLTILTLASLSTLAIAEAPSYNQITAAYTNNSVDVAGLSFDFDGYALAGSVEVSDRVFLEAAYVSTSIDDNGLDGDVTGWGLGIGYILTESNTTNTYIGVGIGNSELESNAGDADADSYNLTLGIRSFVSDNLELSGALGYIDSDGSDSVIAVSVGADWYFTPEWSAGLGTSNIEGDTSWAINASYHF